MASQIRWPHQYSSVLRSRFFGELNDFRAWLDARDYNQRTMRQHLIRLDRVLREMGREPGAMYTPARLRDAFGKHNASPAQRVNFRSTEHRYRAFLTSEGRLLTRATSDRFAELRGRYQKELIEVRGFSTSTLSHHGATVADFLRRGLRPGGSLRELTREDIERYMVLKSKENTRQSMQHTVAVLRSFLRFCHDQREIDGGLDCIDTPRTYRGELLPRALAWSDIQALLRSIDRNHCTGERDYAIVHLMAHYGLRPSEIVTLRFDSIDWESKTLRVRQRKTRSDLVLPIATPTVKVLRRYLKRFRARVSTRHPELFVRDHCPHRPLKNSAICEMFSRRARHAGLGNRKYSAYSLRHGFALRLLERGVGVKAIGDVLGHRDLESTCVYLRLDMESLRPVALPVPQTADTRTSL